MKLGILILQYNSVMYTENLAAIIPEAIIIDNGSTKPYRVQNEVIRLDKNYGFTIGWNKGIQAVYDRFDAFWLMNNDIDITRQDIERIKQLLNDRNINIVSPSYNGWADEFQNKNTGEIRNIGFLEFCAPVITKKVFDEIGFFDERYSYGYGLEWDFCYKARKAGFGIYIDDRSSFYHYGHKTTAVELGDNYSDYEQKANDQEYAVMEKIYGRDWRNILMAGLNLKSNIKKVLIYTTIFGNYNELKPIPKQNIPFDAVCITDNEKLQCPGWQVKKVNIPRLDFHPRMRAKYYKLFPWEAGKHDISIFIDGSIEIIRQDFIDYCLRNLLNDMLLFQHPEWNTITREAYEAGRMKKYTGELLTEQVEYYKQQGFKDDIGLYACGIMVRKHTGQIQKIMSDWWMENIKWTFNDQVSLPYVLWKNKYQPSTFRERQYKANQPDFYQVARNDYFNIIWHKEGEKYNNTNDYDCQIINGKTITSAKYDRVKMNHGINSTTIKKFNLKICYG